MNLVVYGNPKWRELIDHLRDDFLNDLGIVDLEEGKTVPRRGLVSEILRTFGIITPIPADPGEDLVILDRMLSERPLSRLALLHFDLVPSREDYDVNLFATLRNLLMESRKLVLLAQSRTPFTALLPDGPLSDINIQTVELRGSV